MRVYRETYNDRKGLKQTARCWYIDFIDHRNKRHKLAAFTDKRKSEALAMQIADLISSKSGIGLSVEQQKWINKLPSSLLKNFAKWGLIDNNRVQTGKPLNEHIQEWKSILNNSGVSERFVFQMHQAVKKHFTECGFIYFNDISASKLQQHISELKRTVRKKDEETDELKEVPIGPASSTTKNYHIRYCKQFCKWLVQDGRVMHNPLEHIKKFAESDAKKRAAYLPEELRTLFTYTKNATLNYGISGYERYLLYRFASETGFRASEIKSLKVKDFDFSNNLVTLSGTNTKNRQDATIPLKPDTAELFKEHFKGKLPNVKAFKMPHVGNVAAMFRKDLTDAEVKIDPDRGLADFHALRHTFGSMLAASNVHPKTAQELMRHSDINLTMSRYTHTFRGQTANAINALPDLGKQPESQTQVKTGTDDNFVSACCSDKLCRNNDKKPEKTGIWCDSKEGLGIPQECIKTALKAENTKAGEEIRTLDFQLGKLTFYR